MPGPGFTDIRRFTTIDSTNRYLLEEARRGAPDGVVAVADHQSAGRGRLGRRWEAPEGTNLLLSVLVRTALPAEQRHLASAVVALAAADAVEEVAGLKPGIKWPNDLVAPDGRKLAGALAEADLADAGPVPIPLSVPIVVGIGINVNWPRDEEDLPQGVAGSATSLYQQVGHPVERSEVLSALLRALGPRRDDLETPAGRTRQAESLRSRCTTVGTVVRVELARSHFEGLAVDTTGEGHLVVDVDGRRRTVVAGDVIHVRPPGPAQA
ncbi:MAG: biotin--[acetyl-CoA-carboxylase] ligase [Acidimicrobiales bacterium]|jgi:BirA family biotin operon repressor/biotin-[acetyl-CoA-carboxylase] ligase